MTSPITPLADRVVAQREKPETTTASGLYLPESAKEKPVFARVVAVGPDVSHVTLDDKIIYKQYQTTELTVDGVEYLIVKEEDILATVAKKEA